ncbi:MAG: NAD(P)-binding domain-containing protein, partial [Candidatus Neomarinimicrobiota bacterium]|nr:NAD(P)-binding domain-containing protein [Candidatus Neomarinimicrobiota bacterium]
MKSIGIIGLGRFGKVLASILQKGYKVSAFDIENNTSLPGVEFCDIEKIINEEVIFIAVPIRHFKSLIIDIAPR